MYKVGCNSDNKIFLRTNNSSNINKANYHENTHVNSDSTKCHQCQQKTPVCLYLHITMKHVIYNMYNTIFITDSPEKATNINKTNYHLSPSDWIQKMRDHDIWHWKSRSLFVNFNKGHRGRDRMVVELSVVEYMHNT
jgi:hypothetical protein